MDKQPTSRSTASEASQKSVTELADADVGMRFDATHFAEMWKSGPKTATIVFAADLKWVDTALAFPVTRKAHTQLMWTLEQLPLTDPAFTDVRLGTW
jgi:hypothetical protein